MARLKLRGSRRRSRRVSLLAIDVQKDTPKGYPRLNAMKRWSFPVAVVAAYCLQAADASAFQEKAWTKQVDVGPNSAISWTCVGQVPVLLVGTTLTLYDANGNERWKRELKELSDLSLSSPARLQASVRQAAVLNLAFVQDGAPFGLKTVVMGLREGDGSLVYKTVLNGHATARMFAVGHFLVIALQQASNPPEQPKSSLKILDCRSGNETPPTQFLGATETQSWLKGAGPIVSFGAEAFAFRNGAIDPISFGETPFGQPTQIEVVDNTLITFHQYPNWPDVYPVQLRGRSFLSGFGYRPNAVFRDLAWLWSCAEGGSLANPVRLEKSSQGLWAQLFAPTAVVEFDTTGKMLSRLADYHLVGIAAGRPVVWRLHGKGKEIGTIDRGGKLRPVAEIAAHFVDISVADGCVVASAMTVSGGQKTYELFHKRLG